MLHSRQHHWSILVKMFDFLCTVTSVLSSTDVLFSVHPHSWSHLCYASAWGKWQGLGWVIGLLCQLLLVKLILTFPWTSPGTGACKVSIPTSRYLLQDVSVLHLCCPSAHVCTLVFLLSLCAARAAKGLCLLQQRWLKYKDILNFYPECCSHTAPNWTKRSAGWWTRTTQSV